MTDRPDDGPPSATPGAPPHVLVVDDNEAHVEIIRRELEDDGLPVRITVARTLARCRDLIRRDPPALALIDLNLPDGLATDLLPRDDGEAEFPIVIMTAAGSEAMAAGAIRAGAHDYICKSPQAFAGIARTVHAALRE